MTINSSMPGRLLKHAPLVEAIFEARWAPPAGTTVDSNYKLFVGRFFDRLLKKYPEPEDLPTASMPEAFVYGQVQQRFRAEKGGWPVVQVGPGVVTVNDTTRYSWENFQPRCSEVVDTVFEAYPKPENLHFIALQLRHIELHFIPQKLPYILFCWIKCG